MSQKIQVENGVLKTPNNPVIPLLKGTELVQTSGQLRNAF